jgi:glucokinase
VLFPVDSELYVALDIGGTKCAASLGTADAKILSRVEASTSDGLDEWPAAGDVLCDLIYRLLEGSKTQLSLIKSIGVSCGGPLDPTAGTVLNPPNLPGWKNVPLKSFLEAKYQGLPTLLENDANATALAEQRWGAGVGLKDFAYLTCGTGIGAGLILSGHLYRGKRDLAGELGHAVIVPNGPECLCGKRGCLEALSSGGAIGRAGAVAYGDLSVTGKIVIERAAAGDSVATGILMNAAFYLGIGIANLLHTLDLQRVVLGSVAAYAGGLFLKEVRETVSSNTWSSICHDVSIVPSGLGPQSQDLAALAIALSVEDLL